uniref:Uncharacterized protein n=1 Tax=Avena sativa TaxID=4498 RepID=A0ACD5TFP2_AVESA
MPSSRRCHLSVPPPVASGPWWCHGPRPLTGERVPLLVFPCRRPPLCTSTNHQKRRNKPRSSRWLRPSSRLPNRVHQNFPRGHSEFPFSLPPPLPPIARSSPRHIPRRARSATPAGHTLPPWQIQSSPVAPFRRTRRARRQEGRGRRSRMYGKRASQLLKELDACEPGQLVVFNSDVFDQVIRECNEHNTQFQSLIRYNRAETIQSFRWKIGSVLPHEIQEKLHFSEKEYFKNHSAAIKSYISEMDIDLTVDMVPPKDPYIQVRVLEDIGEVSLGDHSISLTKNSLHFLRRTEAEQFISQGLMEEFLE